MNSLLEMLNDTIIELAQEQETNEIKTSEVISQVTNILENIITSKEPCETINIFPITSNGECNGKVIK